MYNRYERQYPLIKLYYLCNRCVKRRPQQPSAIYFISRLFLFEKIHSSVATKTRRETETESRIYQPHPICLTPVMLHPFGAAAEHHSQQHTVHTEPADSAFYDNQEQTQRAHTQIFVFRFRTFFYFVPMLYIRRPAHSNAAAISNILEKKITEKMKMKRKQPHVDFYSGALAVSAPLCRTVVRVCIYSVYWICVCVRLDAEQQHHSCLCIFVKVLSLLVVSILSLLGQALSTQHTHHTYMKHLFFRPKNI